MAGNSFGELFKLSTFGESHGPAIGGVVDGCPPGIALSEKDIQPFLDKRRPGQSKYTTQRKEPDKIEILSGVYNGKTTGTPIGLLIRNVDTRSKDYSAIANKYRPGHADFTYDAKFGLRDPRGGGRSSARETAVRVAAGAIARKVLGSKIKINAAVVQIGPHASERMGFAWKKAANNPFFAPDAKAAKVWAAYLDEIRKSGNSAGAMVEVIATGVPAGLGEPVFDRLDADLAKAIMSIPAVKGVEIGAGFAAAALTGVTNADEIRMKGKKPAFQSNNAGGTLGGISSGQDVRLRFAVKPTSSILTPRKTITSGGKQTTISTKGRHDPCVGIRAVPIGEAMVALVLADHWLRQRAQNG